MEELRYIQNIHCQKCKEKAIPKLDYYFSHFGHNRDWWAKDLFAQKGCRLLQLYSDRILAIGPDSFVVNSDKGVYIFKLYPERSFEEILYYQKETNRLSEELKKKKIMIENKPFKINICEIENVIKLPKDCVIAAQKFIPGLHEHGRLREAFGKITYDKDTVVSYSEYVNNFINKHYEKIAISTGAKPSELYIFDENFKVDEDNRTIYITDLACVIKSWVNKVTSIRGEKVSAVNN